MQSMGHTFSCELPASRPVLKPSSSGSAVSRSSCINCHATVSGFCLMVLRVLCPLITSAAAFAPHISLKLLLAGKHSPHPPPHVTSPLTSLPAAVTTAEFASLSVDPSEPDLAAAVAPMLAAATQGLSNSWSCSSVASAWQRRAGVATSSAATAAYPPPTPPTRSLPLQLMQSVCSTAILDCLSIRRPDLHVSSLARSAASALERLPEESPSDSASPPELRPDVRQVHPQQLAQELQSPSDGGFAVASL